MDQEIKAEWVADLRSGKFEQTTGTLRDEQGSCCLDVLCDQAVRKGIIDPPVFNKQELIFYYGSNSGTLPDKVVKWAGLGEFEENPSVEYVNEDGDTEIASLAQLNDEDGLTFSQIADLIEDQL
jgi:hypothetical protein